MLKIRLIALMLIISKFACSQVIYVSTVNYELYSVDIEACTSKFITQIKAPTYDISFHPDGQLFGISGSGKLFQIDTTSGDVNIVHDFNGQIFNSLTISADGTIYCLGSKGQLWSVDGLTGTKKFHGSIGYEATGDLTFFDGNLYAAVSEDRIVKVDIKEPDKSTVEIDGNVSGRIFGIVSYAKSCSEVKTYALTDGKTQIYQLDFESNMLEFVCELDIETWGGASTYEFLGSSPIVVENMTSVNPTCVDEGFIKINAKGGSGALKYALDDGAYQTSNAFYNLSSANYTLVVRDNNNCLLTEEVTLKATDAPDFGNFALKNESCLRNNGAIKVEASGGLGALQFSFNNAAFDQTSVFNNLTNGDYTITVKDEAGCLNSKSVYLAYNEPPILGQILVEPTTCGKNNGSIEIKNSKSKNLKYSINKTGFQDQMVFKNVSMGTYNVFVKNDDDCSDSSTVEVLPSFELRIDRIESINPTCDSLGSFIVYEGTGAANLKYAINDAAYQSNNNFSGLEPNSYKIHVKDESGCIVTKELRLKAASNLEMVNLEILSANCGIANGGFSFEIKRNIDHLKTSINGEPFQRGTSNDSLVAGVYHLLISDEIGCKIDTTISIIQSDCPIHVPTAFSPNNDGVNDWFSIYSDASFGGKFLSISVFNRWGQVVFSAENFKNAEPLWDGKLKGKTSPMALFAYVLEVEFGSGKVDYMTGDLMLLK